MTALCVRSVEELETLLYLARNRDRYYSADNVAAEIAMPSGVVGRALEALASRSLLDIRIAGAVLYKLDPASDDSRALVEQTLAAARADRATVLKLILTGRSVAQDFADAFRVDRKRDGRG